MKHQYQTAGIYFSLMLELKYMWTVTDSDIFVPSSFFWEQQSTNISADIIYQYKVKCGDDTGLRFERHYVTDDNKLNVRLWESSRALHRYSLHTQFTYDSWGFDPNQAPFSGSNPVITIIGTNTYTMRDISSNI